MIHVAIKRHPGIDAEALAAALSRQASSLDTVWRVGTVKVSTYAERKPTGAWRIQFYDHLPPGEGGIHLNALTGSGLPFARVLSAAGTVAASHEFCEMLVDPKGDRFWTAGTRDYLVEVCDPCEEASYDAGGVEVSDFVNPAYYDGLEGVFTDHLGLLGHAPELLYGGYLWWVENGHWHGVSRDLGGTVTQHALGEAVKKTRAEKDALLAAYLGGPDE